jgi:hypothetical protein
MCASRGLCQVHYVTARSLVNAGRTTWESLEKTGKAKPRKNRDLGNFFLGV